MEWSDTLPASAKAEPGLGPEAMKEFVRRHFEDFVNCQRSHVALKYFSSDFLDHNGPDGAVVGPGAAKQMMEGAYRRWPDLKVEVLDAIAEDDKVAVRNRWTATEASSGKKIEFHGFVLWRFARGQIVEHRATLTEPTFADQGYPCPRAACASAPPLWPNSRRRAVRRAVAGAFNTLAASRAGPPTRGRTRRVEELGKRASPATFTGTGAASAASLQI